MLRERNEQVNIFETLLPFSTTELNPELQKISDFLDANPEILNCFTEQAIGRSENSKTLGRPSESLESVFRMLILRCRHSLGFRETTQIVSDSFSLRHFTRIYYESVPTYSTLCRYDNLLSDNVLEKINEYIVQGAKALKVTRGTKMRVDSTAVEADIHCPTDSSLLNDYIKVVSRFGKQCRKLGFAAGEKICDFTRSAKKQVFKIT